MTELTQFSLGYVKLTDAAPYIIAQEKGMFAKYGLNVTLKPQNSWATLRDKVEAGLLDAAQMLAPMPLASAIGASGGRKDIITPLITSQNGNAITISTALYDELQTHIKNDEGLHLSPNVLPLPAKVLKGVITKRKAQGLPKLRFATVFPFSCHYLQVLDYFAQGNILLDEVELLFIPPTSMVDSLDSADIDGFCVGGPYNASSVRKQTGVTIVTSYDIWEDKAEKVLGLTAKAYNERPEQFNLLCAAIIDACEWLKDVPNRFEAARILAQEQYLDTAIDYIAPSLIGSCLTLEGSTPRHIPHYNRFCSAFASGTSGRFALNRPDQEQGEWILNKLLTAFDSARFSDLSTSNVSTCFREDIFDFALNARIK
jgi:NitT/TauT family transport system ATP-binding protein/nitrate/nitrite transport system substrate-binding protein